MAAPKALGKWLEGSGWKEALIKAEVGSERVAESFISATHPARTRHAHQVTAGSPYGLITKAYDKSADQETTDTKSLVEWRNQMKSKFPQFLYWSTVLELEVLCFQFVRAIREGNFNLYVKAMRLLLPWFSCLYRRNHARWLSIHYRVCQLKDKHISVCAAFNQHSFVVHKRKKPFAAIALDHAHEQVNSDVKWEGEAVGLTESAAALRRWMVAGPELLRMIEQFENIGPEEETTHHESTPSFQKNFADDMRNLTGSLEE